MANYRKIYESAYGPIPKGYIIHHIDGCTNNNALENLRAMSHSTHRVLHSQMIMLREAIMGPRWARFGWARFSRELERIQKSEGL